MSKKPKLSRIWSRLADVRVLVFGDLILDKHSSLDVDAVRGTANSLAVEGGEVRPGGAAAVAAIAASLGARATVAGAIGDDSCGRTLLRLMDEARVEHSLVSVSADYSTPFAKHTPGGFDKVGTTQLESVNCVGWQNWSAPLRESLLRTVLPKIDQFDLLLIPDHGCGACSSNVLRRLIAAATAEKILVCIDPRQTRDYSRYAGASLIKTSRARAEFATGKKIVTGEDALEAGRDICQRWGFLITVITLGREGIALVVASGDQVVLATAPLEVFEPSGAREMALSVIGHCLANGACAKDAVRLANLAAGLEIQRLGITPISHADIYQAAVMRERGGPQRRATHHRSRATLETAKLVRRQQLLDAVCVHREQRRRIALTIGRFEHFDQRLLAILESATEIADVVIAGVCVPEEAGDDLAAFSTENRARMLATSPWVDYVVEIPDSELLFLVDQVRPDVLLTPGDSPEAHVIALIESYGGEVRSCAPDDGTPVDPCCHRRNCK